MIRYPRWVPPSTCLITGCRVGMPPMRRPPAITGISVSTRGISSISGTEPVRASMDGPAPRHLFPAWWRTPCKTATPSCYPSMAGNRCAICLIPLTPMAARPPIPMWAICCRSTTTTITTTTARKILRNMTRTAMPSFCTMTGLLRPAAHLPTDSSSPSTRCPHCPIRSASSLPTVRSTITSV